MKTRQSSLHKNCDRFSRRKDMGTKTQDSTNNTSASFGTEHAYSTMPVSSIGADSSGLNASTWHGPLISPSAGSTSHSHNDTRNVAANAPSTCAYPRAPSPPQPVFPDYHEELAQMLISMVDGRTGEDLADAFREGSNLPPITRQSLSELDIQNIIHNVKLRHDINFDRDLSFRPNLDGARGQEKSKSTERYWKALAAELELYARLFHDPSILAGHNRTRREAFVAHAKRRIPIMFDTIREILKSLVPDRDHGRVEEHFDVPMLMQEIERGVCDFTRLAAWLAQFLKEHCAPMRDPWVDQMTESIRAGVSNNDTAAIVDGLCRLMAVLEIMKLDVANHQIRNLKPILIDDTVNFEKQYHLERLVKRRSRVNVDVTEAWYRRATWEFMTQEGESRMTPSVQLGIFSHAVVAQCFDHDTRHDFPETFHLDHDRLRALKAEIEDLVHLDICLDVFAASLRQLNHGGDVTPPLRQRLRESLVAVMGDAMGYGATQWIANSESLSLEILRHTADIAGKSLSFDHATLSVANENLLCAFYNAFASKKKQLEKALLERVNICTARYNKSTLMDAFNNLVPHTATTSLSSQLLQIIPTHTSPLHIKPDPESAKWQDIAQRLTHIILLHWRIWKDIAYIPQDTTDSSNTHSSSSSHPKSAADSTSSSQGINQAQTPVAAMHTGDAPDAGPDTHMAHKMSSR